VTTPDPDILDAIIVGGGPAGLSAALLLARCCKRIVVIDAGKPRNAAAHRLHGFLTRDGTPPDELLRLAREEIAGYGVEVISDAVARCRPGPGHGGPPFPTIFTVETEKGRVFTGRKLLLATGMCDRLPELPGVRECYGNSVHHCPYCDGYEHCGKRLIAFSEEPADAVGLGIALRGWSDQVTVLTHGHVIDDEQRERLRCAGVHAREERVVRLLHDDGRLTAIELESIGPLEADVLFFNAGQDPTSDLAGSLGCTLDENAAVETGDKQQAPTPGLFLAGDVDGDVQFIIVAAAEGATAAVAMNRELQDENLARAAATRGGKP